MSKQVADAELDHDLAGEESSIPPAPTHQDFTPTMSNTSDLAIPARISPPSQLPSESHQNWEPKYIHTAKCDRCQQHNTSVVQRNTRTNRQFCKVCMYLNISDGLYSVNDGELDWSPQSVSGKRKPRKSKQLKKGLL
jgi:hypothetical protein